MAEGVASYVNVSIEALTQVIEQYDINRIVYANEETVGRIRKLYLMISQDCQYDYVRSSFKLFVFLWNNELHEFVNTETIYSSVFTDQHAPNSNELYHCDGFGNSFLDFVQSSNSDDLRVVYYDFQLESMIFA